ncbi:hypothetical protein EGJ58_10520 [Brucella anthropi]|nr:hypothetical protein EGJ58_10520 [Brucella anthropi]
MLNRDVLYILALICVTIILNQDESTQIILLKLAASVLFWGIYTNRTETRNNIFIIDDKYHIYIWRVFIDSVFLSCWFAIFSWSPIISVYDIILIFLVFISVYIVIGSTYYYINQIRKNVDF